MADQNSCGALLKQINDALEKNANNTLRPKGLTVMQMRVLLELDQSEEGTLALKTLEKCLRVAQSTAAGIVMRLEQKALAEGFNDKEDRRVKWVRITAAGVACCQQADVDMCREEQGILSGLTPAERSDFLVLLKKVRDNLA